MAKQSYDASLRRLLLHEGGYTNHPADPGGPTNFGITIFDYRKYVKPGATAADVRAMKLEEAKAIYRAKYWDAMRCDELPAGVDDSVFDYGVNSGIGRSKKVLQRVVGVEDDGVLGPKTMAAIAARDPKAIIVALNDERLRFLRSLRTWPVFGRGWGRRVAEVRAYSLQLAETTELRKPVPAAPWSNTDVAAVGKGMMPLPPALKVVSRHGGKLGGAGAAAAGIGAWDWIAHHPIEATVLALGAILVVGGVVRAIDHFHQLKQEAATPGVPAVPATV